MFLLELLQYNIPYHLVIKKIAEYGNDLLKSNAFLFFHLWRDCNETRRMYYVKFNWKHIWFYWRIFASEKDIFFLLDVILCRIKIWNPFLTVGSTFWSYCVESVKNTIKTLNLGIHWKRGFLGGENELCTSKYVTKIYVR